MQVYQPLRAFSHGESGVVTCFPLDHSAGVGDRGRLLAEIEFLATHAPAGQCACVVVDTRPHLATLALLFPGVSFYAYDAAGAAEEYDPEAPAATYPRNVYRQGAGLTKEAASGYSALAPLLVCAGEPPERMLALHALMRPRRALFLLRELPPDFLSGPMLYPVHSEPRARACYLDAPQNAHARLCYPAVWEEELAFFQMILRVPGKYDMEAETAVLHLYAHAVAGAPADNTWHAIEQARRLLPALPA